MTTDPIPAPMVQLPAETVEKLREALRFQFSPPKRSQVDAVFTAASAVVDAAEQCEAKFARLQMERVNVGAEYEAAERRANRAENERDRLRALLDAATPAASVPAADSERVTRLEAKIIAIANQRDDALAEVRRVTAAYDTICVSMERWKERAEQADKGEARTTCTHGNDLRFRCEDCEGWTDMGAAPAAPPEPVCRCGPTPYPGTDAPMEDCPIHYPPAVPARVPVNDEAEAAWQAWRHQNVTPPTEPSRIDLCDAYLAGWQAGHEAAEEHADFCAARGEDA